MSKRIKRQTIKHIPHEIIEEILFNLPVKSLLRFKSVSKPWRFLISSKHFTKEHLKKSSDDLTGHNLIYASSRNRLGSCPLKSFLDEQQNYEEDYSVVTTWYHDSFMVGNSLCSIVGSCNGLIFITASHSYILWNPSTRQEKIIPRPRFSTQTDTFGFLYHLVYGFGYDDSTDDYKVVSILVCRPSGPYKTEMYSLRTNSWKEIGGFEKGYVSGCFVKYVNGKFHWLVTRGGGDWDIVSLSLVDEKYGIVATPPQFSELDRGFDYSLDDLGGYLSLIRNDDDIFSFKIWVMMKYGDVESWTNIYTVANLSDQRRSIDELDPLPIWLTKNGDVVVSISGSRVYVSNGKKKSPDYRVYMVDGEILRCVIYVESLVAPSCGNNLASDHHALFAILHCLTLA